VSKDLPEYASQHSSKARGRLPESIKACHDILKEMLGEVLFAHQSDDDVLMHITLLTVFTGKKHATYAWPFYKPVDTELLEDYKRVIKTPMDLGTMKAKMECELNGNSGKSRTCAN
jgi:hypothetical protein